MDLTGDRGAKGLLSQYPECIVHVPIEGQAAITDLDTLEDWQTWLNVNEQ